MTPAPIDHAKPYFVGQRVAAERGPVASDRPIFDVPLPAPVSLTSPIGDLTLSLSETDFSSLCAIHINVKLRLIKGLLNAEI